MRLNLVLLVAALALAGGVAAWGYAQPRAGESATYDVSALGPSGPLLEERVDVADATALSALQAAATRAGFALDLEEYPGMGTYVRAVGGHRASGASGWVYEVLRGGTWTSGDRSAAVYPLQKGDALRWSWTAG